MHDTGVVDQDVDDGATGPQLIRARPHRCEIADIQVDQRHCALPERSGECLDHLRSKVLRDHLDPYQLLASCVTGKNTSFVLDEHYRTFIDQEIASGRYRSVSEVIRSALRLLEDREAQLRALRGALEQGERSGASTSFDFDAFPKIGGASTRPRSTRGRFRR